MSKPACAAALVALGLVATYAFEPGLGHFIWSAMVWGILMMSTLTVLAVLANILMVLIHMWTGYTPKQEQRLEQDTVELGNEMLRFESTSCQDEPKRVA
jgi:RsiW-degrading membrane proteinase PrsW (M82 family)